MNNVKIVFTDLDSTLTKEPGIIDIKNKIIFKKLKDIGIPVVINTGRALPYIIPICQQFETSNYVISSNGAEIYNIAAKKIIYRSAISKENINKLDEYVDKYKLYFTANGIGRRYTNKEDKVGYIKKQKLEDIEEEIAQVVIQSYSIDDMKYLRRDIETETTLKIANKSKQIEENQLLYYDIVNSDVSKGKALEILCEHLNIDKTKSMAIGDSGNDFEMLKTAGYKVAVANATDDLKEIADIITLSSADNGVEIVLNELYKNIK